MAKCSRCGAPGGRGKPPICDVCYDIVMREQAEEPSALDHIMNNPSVQRLIGRGMDALNAKIDQVTGTVVGRIDSYAQIAMKMAHQQQQQQAPQAQPKRSPREVLHFGPDEPLTADLIKTRKRALASMVHPDKNGSVEAMQAINEAADLLMKEI